MPISGMRIAIKCMLPVPRPTGGGEGGGATDQRRTIITHEHSE